MLVEFLREKDELLERLEKMRPVRYIELVKVQYHVKFNTLQYIRSRLWSDDQIILSGGGNAMLFTVRCR